ncbi:hypothetical protein [Chryseobacterium indologenes]|uniref:hypothetical protein n=2 Tax=Chryseobacterium TaxID=59732 RepID=UPI002577128A|nr:hypothetical protein [Chryseobacterium indologenes]
MTSKKIYTLFFILFFYMIKVNAQFVGYYKFDDEDLDSQSPSLFILPNNEFYFFTYGSWKTGKWSKVDEDNIVLTEVKAEENPIEIYGKFDKNKKDITINLLGYLNGPSKSYAFINFSRDISAQKKFQPIFNDDKKLFESSYEFTKNNNGYNWMTISIPRNKNKYKNNISYPFDALSYTYPINKKYNYYIVIQNIDSILPPVTLKLTKQNKNYYIGFDKFIKQKELTAAETLKKIQDAKISVENGSSKKNFGTKIPYQSVEKSMISESSVLNSLDEK